MWKKLFILLVLLFLTGCKANYNLQINFSGNYVESGTIYFNKDLLGKGNFPSDEKEFLKEIGQQYRFDWLKSKKYFSVGNYFGYEFSHVYKNYNNYSHNSPVFRNIFGGLSIVENDHYVKMNTANNYISNFQNKSGDISTIVEGVEISITLPYKVVDHNANSVNAETNTYKWILNGNSSNDKNIKLSYRDNELYTYNPIYLVRFVEIQIWIFISLVVLLLIVLASIKAKSRSVNKI